jgi:hypothetical protein
LAKRKEKTMDRSLSGVSCAVAFLAAFLLPAMVAGEADAGKSGKTSGTVVKSGETLTLRTGKDERQTFFVQWKKKGEKWVREEMADIALKKTLRKGMPVTVKWSVGEKNRKYIDKLIATGSVKGEVVAPRRKGVLLVKVDGIEEPIRFVSRWIKRGGRWIPDPKEVRLIASVETGSTVTVSYELEEHLRIDKLSVVDE